MGKKNPAVDAYIGKAAPFAKPILQRVRQAVHAGCPDVEETIKWGSPTFEYKGILCGMAAFKDHAVFGFWKRASLLKDIIKHDPTSKRSTAGYACLYSVEDLPSEKKLTALVKQATALQDKGVKETRVVKPKPPLPTPAYFTAALRKNPKAAATFKAFSPSHRREYLEWITEAKTEATRTRRVETAIEWIAAGKGRNWKYERR